MNQQLNSPLLFDRVLLLFHISIQIQSHTYTKWLPKIINDDFYYNNIYYYRWNKRIEVNYSLVEKHIIIIIIIINAQNCHESTTIKYNLLKKINAKINIILCVCHCVVWATWTNVNLMLIRYCLKICSGPFVIFFRQN